MADYTPNYGLAKPEEHEYYTVDIQNQNTDKIDTALGEKANGNGAVWYATEVTQRPGIMNYLNVVVPGFVFSEGCTLVVKLPVLDKSTLTQGSAWSISITDPTGGGIYRMVSGGATTDSSIRRDMLLGNNVMKVTLSRTIPDPHGNNDGTAFISPFQANRDFYSLEALGFVDSDFALDTVETALEKIINTLPGFSFLHMYIFTTGGWPYPTFEKLMSGKILADTGIVFDQGSLLIQSSHYGGTHAGHPSKVSVWINSGTGDNTREYSTFFDNTLGVFKPVNVGSNKNLLYNWDFRNPVNQKIVTSWTSGVYMLDCWKLEKSSEATYSAQLTENGLIVAWKNAIAQRRQLEFDDLHGFTVTASAKIDGVTYSTTFIWNKNSVYTGLPPLINGFRFAYNGQGRLLQLHNYDGTGAELITAIKLEIGSVSTLAYDPPADYDEQLALCQRYQIALGDSGNYGIGYAQASTSDTANAVISLPEVLRIKKPTYTLSDPTRLFLRHGVTDLRIISFDINVVQNIVYLYNIKVDGTLIPGTSYWLRLGGTNLLLDANIY